MMMTKKQQCPTSSDGTGIEKLPDDLRGVILSNLTLSEAARTSILRSRWKHSWDSVPCLNFDASGVLPEEIVDGREAWYVSWVRKVLESRLRGHFAVKELRISCCLGAHYIKEIDKWVRFALTKQVELLDLEFGDPGNQQLSEEECCEVLSGLFNLRCLTSLLLSYLKVTAEFIKCILSSCPLLEHLSLHYAGKFTHLDVSSVRLRRLKIFHGHELMPTKLCAPKLRFFELYGTHRLRLVDVSEIVDLTIFPDKPRTMFNHLKPFCNYLPQLQMIELYINKLQAYKLKNLPALSKLKSLTLHVESYADRSWRSYIDLAKACPFLEFLTTLVFLRITLMMFSKLPDIANEKVEMEEHGTVDCHSFQSLGLLAIYTDDVEVVDSKLLEYCVGNSPRVEFICIFSHGSNHLEVTKAMEEKCRAFSSKLPVQTKMFVGGHVI